jgi:[FeFe] hydrogenase H-cluster maturation GTPase HydF
MNSMNETPQGERLHIGIFGRRNAGKSSLLNSLTGQDIAVVSEVKGTTTDPVYKAMELLPIGPVVFIDTAGIDDNSELGELRIAKTKKVLRKTDIALLVVDCKDGLLEEDKSLIAVFEDTGVKHLVVYNKSDLQQDSRDGEFRVSCKSGKNIHELKEKIAEMGKEKDEQSRLVAGLIKANDVVILVVPIDKAAPKGRLILPQQQAIRDILEAGAVAIVTREVEFAETLQKLKTPPVLVITDSQAFEKVSRETPPDIPLTSFSILMARYKGVLESAVAAAKTLDDIQDGEVILIAEGCTHHRQCDDIGTVKFPNWIKQYTGKTPEFEFSSGTEFPQDLSRYKLVIHCGGCMLNSREMMYREHSARSKGVPITNYGVAISYMQGILERCLAPVKVSL